MRVFAIAILLSSALFVRAHGQDPAGQELSVKLPSELDSVLREYEMAWSKGDGKALASLFTVDGYVLQPNRPPIRGRDGISKVYQGEGDPLVLRPFAFGLDATIAFIVGGFAYKTGEPDRGKFTLTLRKVDGKWLIASDMENSNQRRFGGATRAAN